MITPRPKKYLFTQLSAPIAGLAGVIILFGAIKRLVPSMLGLNTDLGIPKVIFFLAIFMVGLMGSMYLWGRILVKLGILTKEEAAGYPYSKPWEQRKYSR